MIITIALENLNPDVIFSSKINVNDACLINEGGSR